jgi:hypothetical protein
MGLVLAASTARKSFAPTPVLIWRGAYSVQNSAPNRWSLISDCVGILVIGVQLFLLVRWLVPNDGSRVILGVLAYIVLAGVALYLWHKDPPVKNLSEPSEWAMAIVVSIVMGGVSFGIDMLIGLFNNPKLSPVEAGTHAGSPFGFPLTVMLCPGFTMLAIAGLLRALMLRSGPSPTRQS